MTNDITEGMGGRERLTLAGASPAWGLIMQSGVGVECRVGITLAELLRHEFAIPDKTTGQIDSILLDGMPVDDLAAAVVPDGSRLALAAGLPGIAGLAMKRGSAVRALRGGITHQGQVEGAPLPRQGPGRIILALYSLALPLLAGHFLRRGVWVTPAQVRRYARFCPDDLCQGDAGTLRVAEWLDRPGLKPEERILLVAAITTLTP